MVKLVLISVVLVVVMVALAEGSCAPDTNCPIPFNDEMKKAILDYHNKVRSEADPPAKDMQYLYWDDTLAQMATDYAAKCIWAHNSAADRRFAGYVTIGQNLWGSSGPKPATYYSPARAWYNEKRWFTYGKSTTKVVGHYTQVMQGRTARIGCGMAHCPNFRFKYIVNCHYLRGQFNFKKPYKLGKPCGSCPDKCKDKMCDCQGIVCQNGGKINLNTCKCKCKGRTTGETCEIVECEQPDKSFCPRFKSKCSPSYGFRARNTCVHTCGLCKGK